VILKNEKYDLIVLDNNLKDTIEGFYVAKDVRNRDKSTPIIIYSDQEELVKSVQEIGVDFSKKDISLLESLIIKHSGQTLYNNMSPSKAFLEYSLEILHNCLTPYGFKNAETSFSKLENMLREENVEQSYLNRVDEAKSIFQEMSKTFDIKADVFSREYTKHLEKIRDILLKTQEDFSSKY